MKRTERWRLCFMQKAGSNSHVLLEAKSGLPVTDIIDVTFLIIVLDSLSERLTDSRRSWESLPRASLKCETRISDFECLVETTDGLMLTVRAVSPLTTNGTRVRTRNSERAAWVWFTLNEWQAGSTKLRPFSYAMSALQTPGSKSGCRTWCLFYSLWNFSPSRPTARRIP